MRERSWLFLVADVVLTMLLSFQCVLLGVGIGLNSPEPAPVTATASPPATGRIRTWAAEGHWWVVGDGWGQHHPGCPCHVKGEVAE